MLDHRKSLQAEDYWHTPLVKTFGSQVVDFSKSKRGQQYILVFVIAILMTTVMILAVTAAVLALRYTFGL